MIPGTAGAAASARPAFEPRTRMGRAPVVVISPHNVVDFIEGAGHFWVYMQYALGLQELGCEVFWLEHCAGGPPGPHGGTRLATFLTRLARFGLRDHAILYTGRGTTAVGAKPEDYIGLSREAAEAVFERADLLLNFHYAVSPALLRRFRRTALVDLDPGLLQFWMRTGQLRVPRHDVWFTIGEGVAGDGDGIPGGGRWLPIHPPVSLRHWQPTYDPRCTAFTTVSIWDSDDYVVDRDFSYENTKRAAFLQFADLPRAAADQRLELALYLKTDRDRVDAINLKHRGWRVRRSQDVSATPESYRAYIQRSRGEFSCAKPSYVRLRTAWVSDRTVCYLASGKPVVVQDTGPSRYLPNGEGMFRFSTATGAARALAAIDSDYERHAHAARALAETHFDARKVLGDVLTQAIGWTADGPRGVV